MQTKRVTSLLSLVLFSGVGAGACADSPGSEPVATQRQALANGCRLPTIGAACDPDGDGPATACDGVCVAEGKSISGAECIAVVHGSNEGLPCGGLDKDRVDCVSSCRHGECTASIADDQAPCMPSGSPYFAAVCEGACNAGSCMKLSKPKNCPAGLDAGSGGGGSTEDTGSGGGSDEDTGSGGGSDEDTGSGGGSDEDTGSGGGSDEDTGSGGGSGEDTGSGGGLGGDTGSGGGGGTRILRPVELPTPTGGNDAGTTTKDDPVVTAAADPGDTGGCGCRTASSNTSYAGAWLAAVAIAVARIRRRR